MKFEKHCERTKEILGKRYEEVHRWLDEFSYSRGYRHRKVRHHLEGVLEVKERFGNEAMLAALIHISDDNEGWIPNKDDYEADEYLKEMYSD